MFSFSDACVLKINVFSDVLQTKRMAFSIVTSSPVVVSRSFIRILTKCHVILPSLCSYSRGLPPLQSYHTLVEFHCCQSLWDRVVLPLPGCGLDNAKMPSSQLQISVIILSMRTAIGLSCRYCVFANFFNCQMLPCGRRSLITVRWFDSPPTVQPCITSILRFPVPNPLAHSCYWLYRVV